LIADPRKHFGRLFGVSENYVRMARDLLESDRVAVQAIDAGGDLREAHKFTIERDDRDEDKDERGPMAGSRIS